MISKRVVPSVGGLPSILQLALQGGGPNLHLYVDSHHRRLGPVFRDRLGDFSGVFLGEPRAARALFSAEGAHPRHVVPPPWSLYNHSYGCKRGLFFMDGDEWYKYRQTMNPIFLKKNLIASLEEVNEVVTEDFLHVCSKYVGKEIESLEEILYNHSISFTIGSLIGTSYVENQKLFEDDIQQLGSITNAIFCCTSKLMNLPLKLVSALNLPAWKNFVHAVDSSLVASRKLTEKMLKLKLRDGLLKEMIEKNVDLNVLQALILDLMLAAGDTTSFTTQWALYLLSKNPTVVEKLREDSSSVRGILRETLRLYPAAVFLSRYLQDDLYALDYIIPKGDLVMISLYTIGKLENVYPEAQSFRPDRWSRTSDGRLAGVNEPMAYMPFALGARSCIGRRLAESQVHHTLIKFFSKYNIDLIEEVDMELQMVPVPTKPIRLFLRENRN